MAPQTATRSSWPYRWPPPADAIEIERQRNRMMRQTMGFRHAVVDAHNGDLVAVIRSPDDAYDYCDYFATVRRDAAVLDLWAEI